MFRVQAQCSPDDLELPILHRKGDSYPSFQPSKELGFLFCFLFFIHSASDLGMISRIFCKADLHSISMKYAILLSKWGIFPFLWPCSFPEEVILNGVAVNYLFYSPCSFNSRKFLSKGHRITCAPSRLLDPSFLTLVGIIDFIYRDYFTLKENPNSRCQAPTPNHTGL